MSVVFVSEKLDFEIYSEYEYFHEYANNAVPVRDRDFRPGNDPPKIDHFASKYTLENILGPAEVEIFRVCIY